MFILFLSFFTLIPLILIFYNYIKIKNRNNKKGFILTCENREKFINLYSALITNWFIKHVHSHKILNDYINYHCCRKLREYKTLRNDYYNEYYKAAKDIRDYFYSSVFFYDPYKLTEFLRFHVIQHLRSICDFRNVNKPISEITFITPILKNELLFCIEDIFIYKRLKEKEEFYVEHFCNIVRDFDIVEDDIKRFFNSLPGIRDYN